MSLNWQPVPGAPGVITAETDYFLLAIETDPKCVQSTWRIVNRAMSGPSSEVVHGRCSRIEQKSSLNPSAFVPSHLNCTEGAKFMVYDALRELMAQEAASAKEARDAVANSDALWVNEVA